MDKYTVSGCVAAARRQSIEFVQVEENLGLDHFAERVAVRRQDADGLLLLSKVRRSEAICSLIKVESSLQIEMMDLPIAAVTYGEVTIDRSPAVGRFSCVVSVSAVAEIVVGTRRLVLGHFHLDRPSRTAWRQNCCSLFFTCRTRLDQRADAQSRVGLFPSGTFGSLLDEIALRTSTCGPPSQLNRAASRRSSTAFSLFR